MSSPPITDWPSQPIKYDQSVPEAGEGHASIQWKGTNVCMDVRCRCGMQGHIDADFAYFYKCIACGVTFAVGHTVRLYAIDAEYLKTADMKAEYLKTADMKADMKAVVADEVRDMKTGQAIYREDQ